MKAYLFVDFGSTYTKLSLVDIEKEDIVKTSRTFTSVDSNVMDGFNLGYKRLMENIDEKVDILKVSSCSSAAGGLQIIAIGLVESLTVEAASRAALGARAKISVLYCHELNNSEMEGDCKSKSLHTSSGRRDRWGQ